ncbi:diaminopropionate ammonia-lyase [Variovorax saccharolyticus]|uniref:diaminopropionate ammonia-lyase n=1 Tax=Variovorax saccharolyticus TaxID=3053516 RepID=UPI0025763314|nr:diaminopropionate ammonia-lyase [Variovorax sp. J31P216]MDM0029997.1 diaminopropionate ammonia-lyase [Variovorax sp. J31P216]
MTLSITGPLSCVFNRRPVRARLYDWQGHQFKLSLEAVATALGEIERWPGYAVTPLLELPGMAAQAGLGRIFYKDEGERFGLGSFKALGGAYAVLRLLQQAVASRLGSSPDSAALAAGAHRDIVSAMTVTCATDGNHGRSVAWGARTFGCACVIYVHEGVSPGRRDAIAAYGAVVREVAGTYDDAVRKADADAREHGWHIVSDTSYDGYVEIPRNVMQGYGVVADEVMRQMPSGVRPTHVFVQGGVGGLAASLCAWFWEKQGVEAPVFVVVEPQRADCLLRSAEAGVPTAAPGALDTIMAGLACGEVSLIAWDILSAGADAFLTVSDAAAADTMRMLAAAPFGDQPIVSGESAVAGLAGALLAAQDPKLRSALKLDERSLILFVGTEGATDPLLYQKIVGSSPEEVKGRGVRWRAAT